jgi:hypothetical protein
MTEDNMTYEKIVVKEASDLGSTTDSEPPDIRDEGDHGWEIDLKTLAWDAVRENINPSDYEPKTHVATIHYDLDELDFVIEYLVEVDRERA